MTLATRTELLADANDALAILADPNAVLDERVAMYAVLQQIRLRLDRALKANRDDIAERMVAAGTEQIGPVSISWRPAEVKWPANDEANWGDYQLQDELRMFARMAPDYIRHVPEHWEIATAELGAGVAAGDPVAKKLHAHCKRQRWRTESHRNASLAVKEAKR